MLLLQKFSMYKMLIQGIFTYNKQINQLERENDRLNQQVSNLTLLLSLEKKEHDFVSKEFKTLNNKCDMLEIRITNLQQALKNKNKQITKLTESLDKLRSEKYKRGDIK